MARPLLGITVGGNVPTAKYRSYQLAVEAAGGLAFLVPPTAPAADVLERVDGLLLPGGGDVNPALYGEANTKSEGIDDERDRLEMELVRTAKVPILAICRGIQVANVALGGTLHQHIDGHQDREARHVIVLTDGRRETVNTRHHQAVKDLAPGLTVTAKSDDDVIEAFESEDRRIFAVQCHPEDLVQESAWAKGLFERLVAQASGSLASASSSSSRLRA